MRQAVLISLAGKQVSGCHFECWLRPRTTFVPSRSWETIYLVVLTGQTYHIKKPCSLWLSTYMCIIIIYSDIVVKAALADSQMMLVP